MRTTVRLRHARSTPSLFAATALIAGLGLLPACKDGLDDDDGGGPGGSTFTASVGTARHGIGIGPSGSVWTWGENGDGQLGDGTTTDTSTPTEVTPLTAASQVEAGDNFSLVRLTDGSLSAWGANAEGQLGTGNTTASLTPVAVTVLTNVTTIDVSSGRSAIAQTATGSVFLWGDNTFGQLGNNTTLDLLAPTELPAVLNAIDFAIRDHALAVLANGTVQAWGRNHEGQLGDGTTTDSSVPVTVLTALASPALTGITKVAVGDGFSIALRNDGTIQAWGENMLGAVGDGTFVDKPFPTAVTGLTGTFTDVDASFNTAIALRSDGTVWTWGAGGFGELGNASNTVAQSTPVQVAGLTAIVDIDGGDACFLAVESDGDRWAWGFNASGQLGDGTTTNSNVPVLVTDF